MRYSVTSISAEELDYLQSYWEIRDAGALVGWSLRLLHDLTKADELGWCIVLQKATIDEANNDVKPDPNYRAATLRLKWLAPESDGYFRLPWATLEKKMRKKGKDAGGGETPPSEGPTK